MVWVFAGFAFVAAVLFPTILRALRGKINYKGKHFLITGGSQGIGKALAIELAKRGAHITILARTESKLKAAVDEIRATSPCSAEQRIGYVMADVSDYKSVQAAVEKAKAQGGKIYGLIANAGSSTPGYFLDQEVEVFDGQMRGNYMGAVHVCKAVAPGLVEAREGQIVIVSSAAAVFSFIGYTGYAPTKCALRGLADALRNELIGFRVTVHVAYPPDTATPGFDKENTTKPIECSAFSELVGGKPYPPEAVAKSMVQGLEQGLYHLPSPDFMQNRLVDSMAGITPRNNAVLEWTLLPLLAVISWALRHIVDHFAARYGAKPKRS